MTHQLKKEVEECGRISGKYINKFEKINLTKEEAEKVDCPKVKEAIGYLECETIQEVETGDHIIFIGKVINKELKTEKQRVFHTTGNRFTTNKK